MFLTLCRLNQCDRISHAHISGMLCFVIMYAAIFIKFVYFCLLLFLLNH